MRIIAGIARGRRIDAPDGLNTRPTLDRVKESMFGSIQFDIPGSLVLDLFAGSGNLGIEALSRGASHTLFVDNNRHCATLIESNLRQLGFFEQSTVLCMDSMKALDTFAAHKKRFDTVFLDPPYASGLVADAIDSILALDILNPGGIIVAEHSADVEILAPESMDISTKKRFGDTAVTIIRKRGFKA